MLHGWGGMDVEGTGDIKERDGAESVLLASES